MINVLIGCPTHHCKEYALPQYLRCVDSIRKASLEDGINVDIFLVDNSPENHIFIRMAEDECRKKNIDFLHTKVEPRKSQPIHDRIAVSMNILRDRLLLGKYDWFMILEADVLPNDPHCIGKLIQHCKENDLEGCQGEYYHGFTPEGFKVSKFWLNGFCIVSRSVMEKLPFRYDPAVPGALPDAFLGCDMDSHSIPYGIHPTLQAVHLDSPWTGSRGWTLISEKLYE